MQKRDINYTAGILLVLVFLCMLATGLIQIRFELHRFIYHIYGAYLVIILASLHVFTNWRKVIGFMKKKKINFPYIVSIALIFSLVFTLALGFLQVRLNLPRTRFVYHIYSAYITLSLALIHICFNLQKIIAYLKKRFPVVFSSVIILIIISIFFLAGRLSSNGQIEVTANSKELFNMAIKYHEATKHTYAELLGLSGGLDWANQPTVFKEYPKAELIRLPADFDFNSIGVEEAIEMGPFKGGFSGEPITEEELSRILYHTNGITSTLRYPGLTYYLRAAPSAGALYPTVIYLVVNNVAGLKKGLYHYSVKDHGLHFLKEGDFLGDLSLYINNPLLVKDASVVFIMSTIFYRTKWKYRERGYRYVLLDTGHVGGNLTLIARALGLGSYPIGTFLDDKVNQMLEIDGLKEAAIYINAVGRVGPFREKGETGEAPFNKKETERRLAEGLAISELLHESGKVSSFKDKVKTRQVSYKSYPDSKRFYLLKEFSKKGISLDDTIRKRRSARDYSDKPISQSDLSSLLYYTNRTVPSVEGLYPIEIYVVVNNVGEIARGIYHYNVLEHSLELLKEGDYRFKIANACLGQEIVGNANIAIVMTTIFERVNNYGDRGYRYIHLDAGLVGENIYLEAVSMGLGVCGIGAFFDDQINEMLGIDGVKETVIYLTSVGRI